MSSATLAMAREEYKGHAISGLKEEYTQKLLKKEFNISGHIVTKRELFDIFETLIAERTKKK